MKIELEWQPWQVRVFGFSLAWWFAGAPSVMGWLWRQAMGAPTPEFLSVLMGLSYLMLPVGVIVALAMVAESGGAEAEARRAARWFLLGAFTTPFLLFQIFVG